MNENDKGPDRITVAEALRRVGELISQHQDAKRFPDKVAINATVRMYDPETEFGPERPPVPATVSVTNGKAMAIKQLEQSFNAFCTAHNVIPRSLYNPWGAPPYSGHLSEHFTYDIALSDFEKWAAPYRQNTIPWVNTAREKPEPKNEMPNPVTSPVVMRKFPTGGDALTPLIWAVCDELREAETPVTPTYVMKELQARADSKSVDPKLRNPLLGSTAGGVVYERVSGEQDELTDTRLKARIREWRKARGMSVEDQ